MFFRFTGNSVFENLNRGMVSRAVDGLLILDYLRDVIGRKRYFVNRSNVFAVIVSMTWVYLMNRFVVI